MTKHAIRTTLTAVLLASASAVMLSGCAATLKPAANATPAAGGGAQATAGGVQIVTMTPDFPGIVNIESAVTPVKVNITNNGQSTVLIRYSDFKLVSADGKTYPALPLRKIDATASAPLDTINPILSPRFFHRGFRVLPYYGGIYPGIPAYGGPFHYGFGRYGWDYYDSVFGGFGQVKLPTPEMYENVLPEGVLDPGGSLEGWLYFKHVGNRMGDIDFDASLTTVTNQRLGTITIPYTFTK